MKSILISSAVTALLLLTGCSDKEPVVSDTEANAQQTKTMTDGGSSVVDSVQDGITEDQSNASSSSSTDMTSIELEFASVYFEFDKFSIDSENQAKISADATLSNTSASAFTIKLEGNCDEWGSDEYNFALGLKRANAVKKSLVAEGVNESRITMVSYGESNPTCTDKTRDCWAKNRRVDFKLLP